MMTTTDHVCQNNKYGETFGNQGGADSNSVERNAEGGGNSFLTSKIYHTVSKNRSSVVNGSLDNMMEHGGKLDPNPLTQSYIKENGDSHPPPKENQAEYFADVGRSRTSSNKAEQNGIDNSADSNFLQEMKFKLKRKQDRGAAADAAAAAALAESSDSFPDVTEQAESVEDVRGDHHRQRSEYNDNNPDPSHHRNRRITTDSAASAFDRKSAQEPDSPAVTTSTTATMTTNLTEDQLSDAQNKRVPYHGRNEVAPATATSGENVASHSHSSERRRTQHRDREGEREQTVNKDIQRHANTKKQQIQHQHHDEFRNDQHNNVDAAYQTHQTERSGRDGLPSGVNTATSKSRNKEFTSTTGTDNTFAHGLKTSDLGTQRTREQAQQQQQHASHGNSRITGPGGEPSSMNEHGHSRSQKLPKESRHRHRYGEGSDGRVDSNFRESTVNSSAHLSHKPEKTHHSNSRQTTRPSSGVSGTSGVPNNSKGLVIVMGKPHQRRQTNEKDEAEMDMTHHYHRSVDGLEVDESINNHRVGRGRERRLFDDPPPPQMQQQQQQRQTQTAGDERYDSRGKPRAHYTLGKGSRGDFHSNMSSQGNDVKKKKDYVAIAEEEFKNRRKKSTGAGDGNQNHRGKIAASSQEHSNMKDFNTTHYQIRGNAHPSAQSIDYPIAERKRDPNEVYNTETNEEHQWKREERSQEPRRPHPHHHDHSSWRHQEVVGRLRETEAPQSLYSNDHATSGEKYAPAPEKQKSFDTGHVMNKSSRDEHPHRTKLQAQHYDVDPRQQNEAESLSEPPPLEEFEEYYGRSSHGGTQTVAAASRHAMEKYGHEVASKDLISRPANGSVPNVRTHNSEAATATSLSHPIAKGSTEYSYDAKPSHLSAPMKSLTPNISTSEHSASGNISHTQYRHAYDDSHEPLALSQKHISDLKMPSQSLTSFPREGTSPSATIASNAYSSNDVATNDPTLGYAHAARSEDNRSSKGSVVSFSPSTLDVSGTSAAWRLEEMKSTLKETLDENEDLLKDLQQMISTCEMLEKERADAIEENSSLKDNEFNLQKQIHDLQVRLSEQQEVSSQAQSIAAASLEDSKSNQLLNKLVKDNRQLLQERSKLMMELNEKLREDLAHKETFSKAQAEWEVEHQALRETVAQQQEEIFTLREKLALQKQKKKERKKESSKSDDAKEGSKRSSGSSQVSILSQESGLSRRSQKSSKSNKSSKSHRRSSKDKKDRHSSKERAQKINEDAIEEDAEEDDNGGDEILDEPKPRPKSSLARAVAEQSASNDEDEDEAVGPLNEANESSHSRKSTGESSNGSATKRRSKGRMERSSNSSRTLDSIQEEESKVEIEVSEEEEEQEPQNTEFIEEKTSGVPSMEPKKGSSSASHTRKSHRKEREKDKSRKSKDADSATVLVEQMEALDQKQKEVKDRRKAEVLQRQKGNGTAEHLSGSNHTNTTTDASPSMVIHLRDSGKTPERKNQGTYSTSKSVSSSGGRSKSSVITKKRNNCSQGIIAGLGGSNSGSSRRLTDIQSSIHSIGSGISAKIHSIGRHSHHDTPSNISTELPPHIQKLLQKRADPPMSQTRSTSSVGSSGEAIEKSLSARDVLENTAHGGETVMARRKDLKKLLSTPNFEPEKG